MFREVRICANLKCSNTFECLIRGTRKFCSRSCVHKGRPPYNKGKRISREVKICLLSECNNTFERRVTETRRFCSNSCSGKYTWRMLDNSKRCRKIGEANSKIRMGSKQSKESNEKRSKTLKGRSYIELFGVKKAEELKKRKSRTHKLLWQNPIFREEHIRILFDNLELRPTKPEMLLGKLLQQFCPNQYRYVGDCEFILGGKNPDFVNINGQKKLIELFGDYWHSEEVVGVPREQHEKERIEYFVKYGYKTLIIWESELKNIDSLKEKIIRFHEIEPEEIEVIKRVVGVV